MESNNIRPMGQRARSLDERVRALEHRQDPLGCKLIFMREGESAEDAFLRQEGRPVTPDDKCIIWINFVDARL